MGTETPTFLTDERRAVLESTYDGADNVKRTHKSKIRRRSRTALSELIEVAESEEIENAEVFDTAAMVRLISAIMSPPYKQITPRWNFDGTEAEYRDRYGYEISLAFRLNHTVDGYSDTLLATDAPTRDREDFGGVVDE